MKILIPTAKELNLTSPQIPSQPLSAEAEVILAELASYSVEDLAQLYKISPERAAEERTRIQDLVTGKAPAFPALQLFDGLMYRNIRRNPLLPAEENYLKDHLLITSSLYGVIPAFWSISPHRLDFLMKVKPAGKTLKSYWKSAFDKAVEEEDVLISLLSSEFEQVFSKSVREKMLTFKFMEVKNGSLKVHSTISKKARGQFLTSLMEEEITDLEAIKYLTFAGFSYRSDLSEGREWVFVKEE